MRNQVPPTQQAQAILDALVLRVEECADGKREARPCVQSHLAPDGVPYDTFIGSGPTQEEAMANLVAEVMGRIADQTGDTVWWRIKPAIEVVDGPPPPMAFQARCRFRIGNKADEKQKYMPGPEDLGPATGAIDNVHTLVRPEPQHTITLDDRKNKFLPRLLPRWRSHKVVEAAKVIGRFLHNGDWYWKLEGEGLIAALETPELRARIPDGTQIASESRGQGGYYVRYEDGYESWSPAAAFENGYTPLSDEAPPPVPNAAAAMIAFWKLVAEQTDAAWPSDATHARVRAIARAMATNDGQDPDEVVMGGGFDWYKPQQGPNHSIALRFPFHPLWTTYLPRINAVLSIEAKLGNQ